MHATVSCKTFRVAAHVSIFNLICMLELCKCFSSSVLSLKDIREKHFLNSNIQIKMKFCKRLARDCSMHSIFVSKFQRNVRDTFLPKHYVIDLTRRWGNQTLKTLSVCRVQNVSSTGTRLFSLTKLLLQRNWSGLFHCAKQQRSLKEGIFPSDKVAIAQNLFLLPYFHLVGTAVIQV